MFYVNKLLIVAAMSIGLSGLCFGDNEGLNQLKDKITEVEAGLAAYEAEVKEALQEVNDSITALQDPNKTSAITAATNLRGLNKLGVKIPTAIGKWTAS